MTARDARAEAIAVVGEGSELEPFVLEPSPPAVSDPPYAADDTLDVSRAAGRTALVPAGIPGGRSWDDWLVDHPAHTTWVAERWLGGPRRLPPVPDGYAASREALHRLGAYVVAPVRHAATGKFGLRFTHGGFGTPFFGSDRQIRVERDVVVDQRGDEVREIPITTLREVAEALGGEVVETLTREADGPAAGDVDAPLGVDPLTTAYLGAWFGMATAALELVRATHPDASRPQLWPGHFDVALELGDAPVRGSYGASPGDHAIAEPYLYVSVWDPAGAGIERGSGPWNATGFPGRELRLSDFPADTDPVDVAAQFWLDTYALLHAAR
jgi:hypothetical protein